jgi:hypothetical protein
MINLRDEIGIVWVDEAAKLLPFLREKMVLSSRKCAQPRHPERLMAYAQLGDSARGSNRLFARRVWSLHHSDDPATMDWTPCEGVHPSSIQAGVKSRSAFPFGSA